MRCGRDVTRRRESQSSLPRELKVFCLRIGGSRILVLVRSCNTLCMPPICRLRTKELTGVRSKVVQPRLTRALALSPCLGSSPSPSTLFHTCDDLVHPPSAKQTHRRIAIGKGASLKRNGTSSERPDERVAFHPVPSFVLRPFACRRPSSFVRPPYSSLELQYPAAYHPPPSPSFPSH